MTAENLVRAALSAGRADDIDISQISRFSAGNSTDFVARVETTVSFVVKVDLSPAIVAEAELLRRITSDPTLPAATRIAFPDVYAIDSAGPVYGYAMENLDDFVPTSDLLANPETHAQALDVLAAAWRDLLQPAYAATARDRLAHNLHADYFGRARSRLSLASSAGLLPGPEVALSIENGIDGGLHVPGGWGGILREAELRLENARPPFGTWIHGDPNPENIMCLTEPSIGADVRLLDPKDWWVGDYIFDAAKILHYVRVTSPVESQAIPAALDIGSERSLISYDRSTFADLRGCSPFADCLEAFARDGTEWEDPRWRERLWLAEAANLIGIVGPRLIKAERSSSPRDRCLGVIALAEAIRLVMNAGDQE